MSPPVARRELLVATLAILASGCHAHVTRLSSLRALPAGTRVTLTGFVTAVPVLAVTEIRRNLARRSACRRRDVLTRRRRGLRDYFLGFGFLACSSAARRR